MAKTKIFGEEYIDMEDIACPKCGCEDFEWDNIDKSGIIVGLDYEYFTIAEANDGVVHWNTKLPRSTSIGHIDCRW